MLYSILRNSVAILTSKYLLHHYHCGAIFMKLSNQRIVLCSAAKKVLAPAGIEPAPSDVGFSQTCYRYTRVLDSNTNRLACLISLTYVLEKKNYRIQVDPRYIDNRGDPLSLYRGFYKDDVISLYSFTFTLCPQRDY